MAIFTLLEFNLDLFYSTNLNLYLFNSTLINPTLNPIFITNYSLLFTYFLSNFLLKFNSSFSLIFLIIIVKHPLAFKYLYFNFYIPQFISPYVRSIFSNPYHFNPNMI